GSGLGLAIVSRIARLHHGTVEAINHPDGGLQVCVRIPLLSKVAGEETVANKLPKPDNAVNGEDY
ncbi:MAG: two-component sensor histidine kinase, partial [Psychrobacter sp.]